MKSMAEMKQEEVGALVHSHLSKLGINVVLSGGAAVSIYSDGRYISQDLDLVNIYSVKRRLIRESMREIGFFEEGRYYKHPDSQFIVEFPPGPLTVGVEPVKRVTEIEFSTGILRIITPTDCVKDRLAAYYHWGDQQSLQQALMVAEKQDIDFEEIRRWSRVEGKFHEYMKIRDRLEGKIN